MGTKRRLIAAKFTGCNKAARRAAREPEPAIANTGRYQTLPAPQPYVDCYRLPSMRPGDRDRQQVIRVLDIEFFANAGAVSLDGLDSEVQAGGDLARVQPTAGKFEHLQLAIGEQFGR